MLHKKRLMLAICAALMLFAGLIAYWTIFPRHGTVEVPGKGTYVGQLRGMTFHGTGAFISAFGVRYEGEFRDGHMHGPGVMYFANGSNIIATWYEGELHGEGEVVSTDGTVRERRWEHGVQIDP